jgi:hypothetical protein
MLLRRIGLALVAVSVVVFAVTFLHLATGNVPSSCSGHKCLEGENRWVLALPGSIFGFVGGVLMAAYAGKGYGRASGPRTFDEVRAGTYAVAEHPEKANARPVNRWTRAWRNVFGYTAAGELFLAALFFVVGSRVEDEAGGAYFTGTVLGGIGLVFAYVGWRAANKDRLHEEGIEGTARILSVTQSGLWMNNNPVIVLDLAVTLPNEPTYEVRHRETVPQVMLGALTQGGSLTVRVNPHNPSDFIVVW